MRIERWGKVLTGWGLIVLAYCVVAWPRHSAASPFSQDEAWLNARIDIMVRCFVLWALPLAALWLVGHRNHNRGGPR